MEKMLNESEWLIQALVDRLNAIAKKNDDEFRYRIDVEYKKSGNDYAFIAEETEDDHTFISGYGKTISDAVSDASEGIEMALAAWGYKE